MTSFSSLLSTIGAKSAAPAAVPATGSTTKPQTTSSPAKKPTNRFQLTPSNAAAGVKRKSEEPDNVQKTKVVKTEPGAAQNRPTAAPSNRFQLSTTAKSAANATQRSTTATASSSNPQRTLPKQPPKPTNATPTTTAGNGPTPKPKGFLSMLEAAKAAQEVAKAANAGGIKHKPVAHIPRKERIRMMEEQKAQQKAGKKGAGRDNAPNAAGKPGAPAKRPAEPLAYQGTMKKTVAAPLAYKGTMRREAPGMAKSQVKQKGMGQDKYGGYASWSDLSDAEDEDEEEYDSDDDMEAGFEDVGMEEEMALRAARKEDQEAEREEARLKAEKELRKRKLQELSRKAAGGKKY